MKITVLFTDVYDGAEYPRTEVLDVPPALSGDEARSEWADEHLEQHTGIGNLTAKESGYFAEIQACAEQPELVGAEFTWGV